MQCIKTIKKASSYCLFILFINCLFKGKKVAFIQVLTAFVS